jgi:hypothetical protein
MLNSDQVAPLSSAQETLLREQDITRDSPGPILRDVDTMLDLVGDDGLRVSESRGAIYTKRLSEINAQLTRSLEVDYKRLTQKAFPTIAGLNLLLRAAALVRINQAGTHPRMERNDEVVASWRELNPTEQYMSLLEAWLNRADERQIFEKSGARPTTSLLEILRFIQKIPPTGWDLDDGDRQSTLRYGPGSAGLALMWLFGLVDLEERGNEAGGPWKVDRIELPAFGKTLLRRLGRAISEKGNATRNDADNAWEWRPDIGPLELTRSDLHHVLQPYFPEWERHLARPQAAFRADPHVFTVQLYDQCRWRVAVPGTAPLDALSSCLLRAARFDRDHLYRFTYEDPYGHEQKVNDPRGYQEPPFADEMQVGALPLRPGAEMTYLYDFGDRWEFDLTLDTFAPETGDITEPTVLEAEGDPPQQYPDPGERW